MATKRHKKKKRPTPPPPTATLPSERGAKGFDFRLAGLMLLLFALFCGVYFLLLRLCVLWASPVLYTLAAVLFLAFFFINGGLSRHTPPRAALPAAWSEEKKDEYFDSLAFRRAFARNIMIVTVPVFGVVIVDMVILFILPVIT